nr:lysosomal Pro-X carboxypeptidase-like [Ipomoea batatas]
MYSTVAPYDTPPKYPLTEVCGGIDGTPKGAHILNPVQVGVVSREGNQSCYTLPIFGISAWKWQETNKTDGELTGGGMKGFETKICERRGVGEALEDGIEIAGVAEVSEPYRRTGFAFVAEETRLPSHLQNGHQRRDSAAAASLDGAPRRKKRKEGKRGSELNKRSRGGKRKPSPNPQRGVSLFLLFLSKSLFGNRHPPLVAAPVLAGNRHPPPPIRVIAGVKLNHYHRALSICCCSPSLICLSCYRRRHQLTEGDEDTTGAATSCSPPPDCLAIAAWFVVRQPTKREERGRELLE